jgi:hypothetical protein
MVGSGAHPSQIASSSTQLGSNQSVWHTHLGDVCWHHIELISFGSPIAWPNRKRHVRRCSAIFAQLDLAEIRISQLSDHGIGTRRRNEDLGHFELGIFSGEFQR